jgi:hypothetical protein
LIDEIISLKKFCSTFFKEILEWRTSREFFYWRLKRRLGENNTIKTMMTLEPSIDYELAANYLQQWFNEDKHNDVRRMFYFLIS